MGLPIQNHHLSEVVSQPQRPRKALLKPRATAKFPP